VVVEKTLLYSLPPGKRASAADDSCARESDHDVVRVGNLARRRIEQHAYIPYTHGSRHVCDRLLTKRRLVLGMKTCAWHFVGNGADAVHLRPSSPATFHPKR